MRVPLSKIYRAFPELDPFSDAECERYVATARSRHQASELLVAFASVLVAISAGLVLARILVAAVLWFVRAFGVRMTADGREEIAYLFGGSLGLIGGVVVGFIIRDFWLRWAIKTCLRVAKCVCGYSLLGLRVRDGAVVCPECGHRLVLASVGLTADGLIAVHESAHPTSANPNDSP